MFCVECGKPIPDNAKFCAECGSAVAHQGGMDAQPPQAVPAKPKKTGRRVLATLVAAVVLVAGAGVFIHRQYQKNLQIVAEQEKAEAERAEAERVSQAREQIDHTIQAFARARTDGNHDIAANQWVDSTPGGHLGRAGVGDNISVDAAKVGVDGLGSIFDLAGGGISHMAGWTLTIDYAPSAIDLAADTATVTVTMTEESSLLGTYEESATIYMREVDGKWLIESISGGTGLW